MSDIAHGLMVFEKIEKNGVENNAGKHTYSSVYNEKSGVDGGHKGRSRAGEIIGTTIPPDSKKKKKIIILDNSVRDLQYNYYNLNEIFHEEDLRKITSHSYTFTVYFYRLG